MAIAAGLPPKFTQAERAACKWLEDCGIREWAVDMLDKSVTAIVDDTTQRFGSLVEFARFHGRDDAVGATNA